ncbi:hypothetical protein [Weissella confusa]
MLSQLYVLLPLLILLIGLLAVYLIVSVLMDFYLGALVIETVQK